MSMQAMLHKLEKLEKATALRQPRIRIQGGLDEVALRAFYQRRAHREAIDMGAIAVDEMARVELVGDHIRFWPQDSRHLECRLVEKD
jgi:hypothetical protein